MSGRRTYQVKTSTETYETGRVHFADSTLVIDEPRAAMHDPRKYPIAIPVSEINSVATLRQENLVYVEAGVQNASKRGGVQARYSEDTNLVVELGHITGQRKGRDFEHWGFGGTVATRAGHESGLEMSLKGRARYRFNRHFSADLAAGPVVESWNDGLWGGFTVGVGVNMGSMVTIRSEFSSVEQEEWRQYNSYGDLSATIPAGHVKTWYNGVMMRGGAGWLTFGVGTVVFCATVILSLAALGSSN